MMNKIAPKTVVITGASRGIGFAMARAFHARGCNVVICGRVEVTISVAADHIGGRDRVLALKCDVRQPVEIAHLWQAASDRFGAVDIWVQNAGLGLPATPVHELVTDTIDAVVATNLTGTIHAARKAVSGFHRQGHGALFIMSGLGAEGPVLKGAGLYGASKAGVEYLTRVLIKEAAGQRYIVGSISPGIVLTELALGRDPSSLSPATRAFLEKVADEADEVAPFLVDRILAARRNGTRIRWLKPAKLLYRLAAAPLLRRNALTRHEAKTVNPH